MTSLASPTALITGGSAGLGRALCTALLTDGWTVITDGRDPDRLRDLGDDLGRPARLITVPGDVADADHRHELARVVAVHAPLRLLVNNASELGGSPPPQVLDLDADTLTRLLAVNVVGPVQLLRALAPHLEPDAVIINVSSDAAVEHYPGWGGYAASKAALDHLTLTLAAEEPDRHWYAVDPGDLRTAMHQAALPGEDISDRPLPATVVPALLALVTNPPASGRLRAADLRAADPRPAAATELSRVSS